MAVAASGLLKFMHTDLQAFCVPSGSTLEEAIAQMDRCRLGIVLIVDGQRRLAGTLTDGDVRRAMLARVALDTQVECVLERKASSKYARPIVASASASRATCLQLLKEHSILHLPVVDSDERVVGLVTLDEFVEDRSLALDAVIMAGGRGSRLMPLTEHVPKPMLPLDERPLIEVIVQQLHDAGITRVNISTHHKAEAISSHLGDGQRFGVHLNYVAEDRPLGTAGALGLMDAPQETLLVINGDILTEVDFRAMVAYHREHGADLTVAVRQYDIPVPFGVVDCEGVAVKRLTEKPQMNVFVNAGIYLLEPAGHCYIPPGERFDMTDLIQRLLDANRPVAAFPIREYWIDIGQREDYQRAIEHSRTSGRERRHS